MRGLEHGVDRLATQSYLQSSRCPPYDKGLLRSILSGAVWTQERLSRANLQESPLCPCCGEGIEDQSHMWWDCQSWSQIRARHPLAMQFFRSDWPECLRQCGIMTNAVSMPCTASAPLATVDLTQEGAVEVVEDEEPCTPSVSQLSSKPQLAGDLPTCKEYFSGAYVVVFTDGASRGNQHAAYRRAGCGAWWGFDNPRNFGVPLRGELQTNQRAELMATIRVLELELRDVEVRSDSKYVLDGVLTHLPKWARDGWRTRRGPLRNTDLWKRMHRALLARRPGSAVFRK
eukprot:8138979-Karenia_brevis.AAC.1